LFQFCCTGHRRGTGGHSGGEIEGADNVEVGRKGMGGAEDVASSFTMASSEYKCNISLQLAEKNVKVDAKGGKGNNESIGESDGVGRGKRRRCLSSTQSLVFA
jgi:hypothetical protein